jgi:hypothetical protein
MTEGFWHNTARICNLCLRSYINNKRKIKCNYFKTHLPSQYYGEQACNEQNETKNYKPSREIKKYISTSETKGANETNNINRVLKNRYFLKHPSEPRCNYTNSKHEWKTH